MLPCGDIACLKCFYKLYDSEDKMLTCKLCDEEVKISWKFYKNVHKLKQESMTVSVFCQSHRENIVSYYSPSEKLLFCLFCRPNNVDYQKQLLSIKCEDIDSYCDKLINLLSDNKTKSLQLQI